MGDQGSEGLPTDPVPGLSLWPELSLDFVTSEQCAGHILTYVEYRGTEEEIARDKQRWETRLSLPMRYLDDEALGALRSGIERADSERGLGHISNRPQGEGPCWDEHTKLMTFWHVRSQNPMGGWRANVLSNFWRCHRDAQEGEMSENRAEECRRLIAWIPEDWTPPVP